MTLNLKVAIITGATSLMAEETCKKLVGWDIHLCSRSYNGVDVTDPESVKEFLSSVNRVDALINIAGGKNGISKNKFLDMTPDEFNKIMDVNFNSVVNMTRACIPKMQNGGSIISIVSAAAYTGLPRMSAYSAAKAAVLAFTKTIAQEYAEQNIRANCILPGYTLSKHAKETPINKLTSLGPTKPADVADMIEFLLSNKASHITGSCFDISGGVALH